MTPADLHAPDRGEPVTDYLALGRRLLAAGCPWREGMRWVRDRAPLLPGDQWMGLYYPMIVGGLPLPPDSTVPDLRHAGTCAEVIEALGERIGNSDSSGRTRWLHLRYEQADRGLGWRVWVDGDHAIANASDIGVLASLPAARALAVVLAWEGVGRVGAT